MTRRHAFAAAVLLAAGLTADVITTEIARANGGRELWPPLRPVVHAGLLPAVAVAAWTVVAAGLLYLAKRSSFGWASWIVGAAAVTHLGAAMWNWRLT